MFNCKIISLISNGHKKPIKTIILLLREVDIMILIESSSGSSYRYSSLNYEEKEEELILYGDGLKIIFKKDDNETLICLNKLKDLIDFKRAQKKNKLSSGPINNLNNTTKLYKEKQLSLTSISPMKNLPSTILPSSTSTSSTRLGTKTSGEFNNLKSNYTPEKSATLSRQNITPESNREKDFESHSIEKISKLPTPKNYRTPPKRESHFSLPVKNLIPSFLRDSFNSSKKDQKEFDDDFHFNDNTSTNLGKRSHSPITSKSEVEYVTSNQKKDNSSSSASLLNWNFNSSTKKRKEIKCSHPGISNLGNTCFMAATIQALSSLDELMFDLQSPFWSSLIPCNSENLTSSTSTSLLSRSGFTRSTRQSTSELMKSMSGDKGVESCLLSFHILLREIISNSCSPCSIRQLKEDIYLSTTKYGGYHQQDAHEFLTDLITILEHGYLRILKNKLKGTKYMSELENVIEVNENSTSNNTNSPTKSIKTISISESSESSSSLLSSSITIGTNSEKNQSQENNEINNQIKIPYLVNLLVPTTRRFLSIMDISLRCTSCNKIRHKKENYQDYSLLLSDLPSSFDLIPLQKLLSSFFSVETRDLACESCKHQDAQVEVSTSIEKFPDILVLHIKRFEYNHRINDYIKITSDISFPSILDMNSFSSQSQLQSNLSSGNIFQLQSQSQTQSQTQGQYHNENSTDNSLMLLKFDEAFPDVKHTSPIPQPTINDLFSSFTNSEVKNNSPNKNKKNNDDNSNTNNKNGNNNNNNRNNSLDSDNQFSNDYWCCSKCTFVNTNPLSLCCEICASERENENSNGINNNYNKNNGIRESNNVETIDLDKDDNDDKVDTDYDLDDEEIFHKSPSELTPYHYELVSVIRHVGKSAYNGHYTCDIKKKLPQLNHIKWYRCDDSVVYQIPKEHVFSQKSDPYILFYQKIKKSS